MVNKVVVDDFYEEVQSIRKSIDFLDDSLRSRSDGGHTILGAIEKQTEAITRLADTIESLFEVYAEVVGYPDHAVEKGEEDVSE